jgi:hypothetical protein
VGVSASSLAIWVALGPKTMACRREVARSGLFGQRDDPQNQYTTTATREAMPSSSYFVRIRAVS